MKDQRKKMSDNLIWGIIMFFAYIVIAYFVVFTPKLLPYNYRDNTKENDDFVIVRIILGVILFLYAIFRGYRLLKYKK